jgi:hypothetical protein
LTDPRPFWRDAQSRNSIQASRPHVGASSRRTGGEAAGQQA